MSKPLETPVLETARLRLREYRLEDFAHVYAMWTDPEVTKHFEKGSFTEESVWTKFLRKVGHWQVLGFGYWIVEEKNSGRFVGEAGFGDYKRDIIPSIKGEPEIGWAFAASAHGKGYATEAAKAAIEWGDAFFGPVRMSCIISAGNAPSVRVAEKCGFKETCRTTYYGEGVILMHRG